jgi:hypothetical protein
LLEQPKIIDENDSDFQADNCGDFVRYVSDQDYRFQVMKYQTEELEVPRQLDEQEKRLEPVHDRTRPR